MHLTCFSEQNACSVLQIAVIIYTHFAVMLHLRGMHVYISAMAPICLYKIIQVHKKSKNRGKIFLACYGANLYQY